MRCKNDVFIKQLTMITDYKSMDWDIKDFLNAYVCYENLITLPLYTKLSDGDIKYVSEHHKEVMKEYI